MNKCLYTTVCLCMLTNECVSTYRDVPITYRPPNLFTISFSLLTVLSNSPVAAANAARSSLPYNEHYYR